MSHSIPLQTIDKIRKQLPDIFKKIGVGFSERWISIKTIRVRRSNGFVGTKIEIHYMEYVDGIVCRFSFAGELEKVRWRLHPEKKIPGF